MLFVATKKVVTTNFVQPLSFAAIFGSGIQDRQKSGSEIRDKHHGSAGSYFNADSSKLFLGNIYVINNQLVHLKHKLAKILLTFMSKNVSPASDPEAQNCINDVL